MSLLLLDKWGWSLMQVFDGHIWTPFCCVRFKPNNLAANVPLANNHTFVALFHTNVHIIGCDNQIANLK